MNKRIVIALVIAFFTFGYGTPIHAQDDTGQPLISGYSGSLQVLPNAERTETTVVLTLGEPPGGRSNQIVFRVQLETGSVPSAWAGNGRVLVGEKNLAVLPEGSVRPTLFKFSEVKKPASFEQFTFDEYAVIGIARFGERVPLTAEEINRLVKTGSPVEPVSNVRDTFGFLTGQHDRSLL